MQNEPFSLPAVLPNSRSRRHRFVCNNYSDSDISYLDSLSCRYIVYGKENAPTTGTPHLQGFVVWHSAKTISSARTILRRCDVRTCEATSLANSMYCKKDGDFVERGDLPAEPSANGRAEIDRWNLAWDCAKTGDFEAIPSDIRIRSYTTLKRIHQDYMPAVLPLAGVCGTWIHGLSGTGKTRAVLAAYPDCYIKPRNLWWDGYQGESVVLLDDVDKYDVRLGGVLKHWADFAPFIAEVKGGSKKIRPQKLIVTSQYRLTEIWTDNETIDALSRRFVVIEKIRDQNIILL